MKNTTITIANTPMTTTSLTKPQPNCTWRERREEKHPFA